MSKVIYFDNSASTQVDPKVFKKMMPYFSDDFANASSIHSFGQQSAKAVTEARSIISNFFKCDLGEIYFTSGSTESNNLALLGLIKSIIKKDPKVKPHVIISTIEHESVLDPIKKMFLDGIIEVDYLSVDYSGVVKVEEIRKIIKDNTVLISVMLANNEIGTIEPIEEIGEIISELNKNRTQKIYFHTDATQAPLYVDCNVNQLKVDLMSCSSHKIHGPKGIGCLYLKKGTPIEPLFYGGGQERKIRSGTYNTVGIVGFGEAIKLISQKNNKNHEIRKMRDFLIKKIKKDIPLTTVTGSLKNRLDNHASFNFKGVEGESIILMLSQKGIMASTGSACSSGSLDPSHVLLALGLKPEEAHGSLRLTLSRFNKKSDIDKLIKVLPPIIDKLRKMSPLKV